MFYAQLQKLCKEKGKKLTPLCRELGMSASGVNRWQSGVLPNGETLLKFAEYFDVSTDYLLGLSEQRKSRIKKEKETDGMNKIAFKSFNDYSEYEIWEAIRKEWEVDNQQDLADKFCMEMWYFSKIIGSHSENLNSKEREDQRKLEKLLDLKLPRSELLKSLSDSNLNDIKLKKSTLSKFIYQKTNNLDQSLVENLANNLNLSPISIISWGIGERKPNKPALDSLIVYFEPAEYLANEFRGLIEEPPTEETSEIEETDA